MPVEGLDVSEEFPIVTTVDKHLAVGLDCLRQQGEGTFVENLFIRRVLVLHLLLLCIYHSLSSLRSLLWVTDVLSKNLN